MWVSFYVYLAATSLNPLTLHAICHGSPLVHGGETSSFCRAWKRIWWNPGTEKGRKTETGHTNTEHAVETQMH